MNSLWTEMAFYVVETKASIASVVATLPVRAHVEREARRTWALQALIHQGTEAEANQTDFAAIALDRFVVIAPPGGHWPRTGEPEWLCALSKAFGRVYGFNTSSAMTQIVKYEAGEQVACVDQLDGAQPAPVLGVETLVDGEDAPVWAAMARLLGVDDVKALLRQGTCVLCKTGAA